MVCHRFPNENKDPARRLEWIKAVGFTADDSQKFKNKYICSVHFADNCSSPGTKRLNANAYPTLNLPVGKCHIYICYIIFIHYLLIIVE